LNDRLTLDLLSEKFESKSNTIVLEIDWNKKAVTEINPLRLL